MTVFYGYEIILLQNTLAMNICIIPIFKMLPWHIKNRMT